MGFLPTQYDFPNSSNYDSDLREVLRLSKELYNEYNSMYNGFLELKTQFDDVNARFTAISARFDTFAARMAGLTDEINDTVDSKLAAEMIAVNQRIAAALAANERTINERLTAAERAMSDFLAQIKALYDADKLELSAVVRAAIASLDGRFDDLADELRAEFSLDYEKNKATLLYLIEEVREEYKRDIADLSARLDDLVKEWPEVWNIARGQRSDVESAILDAYDALRYFANTVRSFDYRQLSAGEQDNKELPAIVWDTAGRDIFYPSDKCRNPMTGEVMPICEVIDAVAEFTHDGRITAAEYAALDLTALEYRGFDMTAYNYKFWSRYILTGELTPSEKLASLSDRVAAIEGQIVTINATLADHESRLQALEL